MSQLPPLLPVMLPPLKPVETLEDMLDPWDMRKLDYDAMELRIATMDGGAAVILTRLEAFRLIGQLERLAASL